MTDVSTPYFDKRGGRIVGGHPTMPWTVRVSNGEAVEFHRFRDESDAASFSKSYALVQSVSFRDKDGRLHRWKYARVIRSSDGRLVVTRLRKDGTRSTRKPSQYFIVPESIIRRVTV